MSRHPFPLPLAIAAAIAIPAAAHAQTAAPAADAGGRFRASITGGTLGIGPELGFRASSMFGVRANVTFLSFGKGFSSDDVDYDGRLKLKSGGVMLDLFPFGGSFRLSAGARINGNKARARATPTATTEIGNTVYTPAQIGTLTGRADVKSLAPALTIGWGGSRQRGFVYGTEAGVLFQGRVRIKRFTTTGTAIRAADLEAERQSLQDDVDDYKIYPILQVSLGYRF